MPRSYASEQVDQRLAELYQHHRSGSENVASFYESGRGYYAPADAGPERDWFGLAFETAVGEPTAMGDCDTPFALQSLSKVSSTDSRSRTGARRGPAARGRRAERRRVQLDRL